jgi:hypothetical protein
MLACQTMAGAGISGVDDQTRPTNQPAIIDRVMVSTNDRRIEIGND